MRIVKLVKQLSLTIYDFQRLNLLVPRDPSIGSSSSGSGGGGNSATPSYDYASNYVDLNKMTSAYLPSPFDLGFNISNEPYAVIEAKFENISKRLANKLKKFEFLITLNV